MATSNKPHAFNPQDVPKPPPTYSQVCVTPILPSSKLITLAGQTGMQDDQSIAPDSRSQARDAYKAVHNCLKAAGATPRDIIHVRHYIVHNSGNAEEDKKDVVDRGWGDLWIEFLDHEGDGHRPPDTVVGVASLAKKELLDAQQGEIPIVPDVAEKSNTFSLSDDLSTGGSSYTIRPLQSTELNFGTDDTTKPIGRTVQELKTLARLEKWVGMRVDVRIGGAQGGILVGVQYWWRLEDILESELVTEEDREWRQCLHDIMHFVPQDGMR